MFNDVLVDKPGTALDTENVALQEGSGICEFVEVEMRDESKLAIGLTCHKFDAQSIVETSTDCSTPEEHGNNVGNSCKFCGYRCKRESARN